MTFGQFTHLSARAQLTYTLTHGKLLLHCRTEQGWLRVCHLPDGADGFYVEVGLDEQERVVVRRSFTSAGPLEGYVAGVELPEGWA